MFYTLLGVTLGVSLLTSGIVVAFFGRPIRQILERIIGEQVAEAWQKFLTFSLFVVGVSSGVQVWKLEQYLQPQPIGPEGKPRVLALDGAAIALEVYRTVLQVLQGMAWALLVFFVVALIAFVLVKRGETRDPPAASA
ncbi:MAG TPA: hypothetical protein VMJ70_14345 [Candidatus Sulfotelmatobacter sp.]|nr:hypothetical protein [Candidatus Sulfotelmatobacter sp.]